MKKPVNCKYYSPKEERLNVISHGLGLILSVLGLVLLVMRSLQFSNAILTTAFVIYGFSLITLYSASTFYHHTQELRLRYKLKIFDHIAIFVLIAGTYTPFSLVTLNGTTGWIILIVAWSIAVLGAIMKIFFTGRFKILSTLMYVGMGWIIIFAIKPLLDNLDMVGVWWLFAGGLAYTIGAILYNLSSLKFNHAIFHIFVLVGSFCHFMSIYNYVTPTTLAS